MARLDPNLPMAQLGPMEDIIAGSVAQRETPMRLLSVFAAIGLVLASIGVYSVLAYYVSQRTKELGVRAALGVTRRELAAMVVRQSLSSIAAGVVLGVAGSLVTSRLLVDLIYQVQTSDLQVITTIVIVLVSAALVAAWLPARRAAAIDALVALRDE